MRGTKNTVTYILVWDNLDRYNMTGSLENLSQNLLCDPRIKATDVKGSFVGFWCRSSNLTSS